MRRLALIAHDGKKPELSRLVERFHETLGGAEVVATGTTGTRLRALGLEVRCLLSGPMGGDAQIAAGVVEGRIDAVIFLRDPAVEHPHEVDVQMLLRLCDLYEVPLATNMGTAVSLLRLWEATSSRRGVATSLPSSAL